MLRKCSPVLQQLGLQKYAGIRTPLAYSPKDLGDAVARSGESVLSQDTSVERVRSAHALVQRAITEINPNYRLYTFGSTAVFGFHEAKSDVDFVALRPEDVADGKGEDSQSQLAKALQTEFLGKVGKSLKRRHIDWAVDEVKRARVPVIKIKSKTVDFDITAHRRNGVRNSALLRAYLEQSPELRWISMTVKSWSKRCGMNGPVGYITSYGFNIMVIYFLLQRRILSFVDPDSCCASTIDPLPRALPLEAPSDPERIGRLLIEFLEYYRYEFDVENDVVTLSRESRTTKEALNWTKTAEDMKIINAEKVAYRFCIEDPYEINLNVGRNVTAFKLDMMRKTIERGIETGMGLVDLPSATPPPSPPAAGGAAPPS